MVKHGNLLFFINIVDLRRRVGCVCVCVCVCVGGGGTIKFVPAVQGIKQGFKTEKLKALQMTAVICRAFNFSVLKPC